MREFGNKPKPHQGFLSVNGLMIFFKYQLLELDQLSAHKIEQLI